MYVLSAVRNHSNFRNVFKFQILSTYQTRGKANSSKNPKCDLIGPPNPDSNLRPIRFFVPAMEDSFEKKFRLKREEVQKWNQEFWTKHNKKFIKEKKEFVAANQLKTSETPLTADEMSVFYKAFLDKTWKTHLNYNMEWYRKNAELVCLNLKVKVFKIWQFRRQFKRSGKN